MKKNINGMYLSSGFVIRGNPIVQAAAPSKFTIVEYGIMLDYTISGMYNHTIGPKVSPNTAINTHMPKMIVID